jgi:uncharacterized protein (TIGR02444 family)
VPADLAIDSPLWHFASRFWARTPAREAALALQESGWSVTDILCALWMAGLDRPLDMTVLQPAVAWRHGVTEALRQIRKALSKGNPAVAEVRKSVAGSELEAEKVELALAYRALAGSPDGSPANRMPETVGVLVQAQKNLQAAAPAKAMDNETSRLLEILATEFEAYTEGERQTCS